MKRILLVPLTVFLAFSAFAADGRFLDVSPAWPRYFADASGKAFVPVGCNICFDYLARVKDNDFMQVHRYLDPGAALDVTRGPQGRADRQGRP